MAHRRLQSWLVLRLPVQPSPLFRVQDVRRRLYDDAHALGARRLAHCGCAFSFGTQRDQYKGGPFCDHATWLLQSAYHLQPDWIHRKRDGVLPGSHSLVMVPQTHTLFLCADRRRLIGSNGGDQDNSRLFYTRISPCCRSSGDQTVRKPARGPVVSVRHRLGGSGLHDTCRRAQLWRLVTIQFAKWLGVRVVDKAFQSDRLDTEITRLAVLRRGPSGYGAYRIVAVSIGRWRVEEWADENNPRRRRAGDN